MAARGMTRQELDRAIMFCLREASIYVSERQRRTQLEELADRRLRGGERSAGDADMTYGPQEQTLGR